MLDQSQGYTRAGVERINDSIRAYVWSILGAQASARVSILVQGPGFDAQRIFQSNVQARIEHEVDIGISISTYQDTLVNAASKLDFVLGEALYLVPSDMNLRIGQIEGYNNEIVVAKADMALGSNQDLNNRVVRSTAVGEVHKPVPEISSQPPKPPPPKPLETTNAVKSHEATKTALVCGVVGVGVLFALLR